jgi:hypothetical protein
VLTAGARLLWNDDGETPNVSLSVFDYGAFPVVLELRNLPLVAGQRAGDCAADCRQRRQLANPDTRRLLRHKGRTG